MVHHGQRLALQLEAGDDLPGIHAKLDDLERDAAAYRVFLIGDIDHAATAFANFFAELVGADCLAGGFGEIGRLGPGRLDRSGIAVRCRFVGLGCGKPSFKSRTQGRVIGAQAIEKCLTFFCRQSDR